MPTLTIQRKAGAKPLTVAQRLDRIIKSARQIMRKDKGLNGDLDRLPMLTWIMFLKFLDDMERIGETRVEVGGRAYRPVVEEPWRWRDWAAPADGITGTDLLTFLSAEETVLPNGSSGPGLFAYLRGLRGNDGRRDRRDVVATVFRGFSNRMESGYLLRDVVNLVDGIRFDSSRGDPRPRTSLRDLAARDARRGRRFRRVLHAATGGALYGRGHGAQARRDRARPGVRHRWLPGRGFRPPGTAGRHRREAGDPAGEIF